MANFIEAFKKTMGHEGGYVDDADDAGGETYRGVARKYHSQWEGWVIIDQYIADSEEFSKDLLKNNPGLQKLLFEHLENNTELEKEIHVFYKAKYWDKFMGDNIPVDDIAIEMFDTGVNMGVSRGVKFLQEGLNLLNRNGTLFDDIKVDGGFGQQTLGTLKMYLTKDDSIYLLKIMNILQGMHYIEYMKKAPTQEKYARGWLKRVTL